ncbi:MAG: biopolymer transporter ExbD [Chitinophagales bacterium]|nr:biopolymer transporter ExbD [Chitinophagales bacterium]
MRFRGSRLHAELRSESLSDIMFFLMLFFLIVSTMVNPTVIKLVLPKAKAGQTLAKQSITISVDAQKNYYLNNKPIAQENIEAELAQAVAGIEEPTVVIRADNTLPVQVVVDLISIGNKLKVKMVLATKNN